MKCHECGAVVPQAEEGVKDFQVNLRRLVFWHYRTAREFAQSIEIAEQAVSGWLKGTRKPNLSTLMRISADYDIDPFVLMNGTEEEFARHLLRRYL